MDSSRAIMYVGLKSQKWDNANGVPERRWNGAGAIAEVSSRLHAEKLLTHPDEFCDVTHMSPEERLQRAKDARSAAQERSRHLRAPTAHRAGGTLLEYATDEQIHAELERRARMRKGEVVNQPKPGPKMSTSRVPVSSPVGEKEFIAEKVTDAVDRIIADGNTDALDANGVPRKAAIENLIGFSLTDEEFAAVLGGDTPTDPLDKTEAEIATAGR